MEDSKEQAVEENTEKTSEQNPTEAPPAEGTAPEEAESKEAPQPSEQISKKSIQSETSKATENQAEEQKPEEAEKVEEPISEKKQSTTSTSKEALPGENKRASISDKEQVSTEKVRGSIASQDKAKASSVVLTKNVAKSSESLERKGMSPSAIKEDSTVRKSRSERLSSKARNVLGSIISIRRLSTTGEFYDKTKGARFMNTYKLDSDNAFNPDKVKKILENVMIEALENLTYDPEKCPKQAKWASSAIRAKVKELQFDRYKLIILVTIGEKNSQDVLVTCRFLWDVDRDRYATYCIENTYVFGIAQCFGIYYE